MSNTWKKSITQLNELQRNFIETVNALQKSKREKPGVCGTWSPRQVVAHMTGWEIETILQFERIERGTSALEHDIDLFNEKSVQQREHLYWDETLIELKEAQKKFNQKALSISFDDDSIDEGYWELINVQIEHYLHHIRQLKKWI